ncbi:MAG: hypothetical protein ACRDTX_05235 [Pseudonocardiaceae bacterium]
MSMAAHAAQLGPGGATNAAGITSRPHNPKYPPEPRKHSSTQ